jgi:protein tyrosine phosphatase (PTP) superfamily phosphohydrolase (DUF442 family)
VLLFREGIEMQPNTNFRCDLLKHIRDNGDFTSADVKTFANRYGMTPEHIRVTIRKLKSENLIITGAFLTESGKKYLAYHKEGTNDE